MSDNEMRWLTFLAYEAHACEVNEIIHGIHEREHGPVSRLLGQCPHKLAVRPSFVQLCTIHGESLPVELAEQRGKHSRLPTSLRAVYEC